MPKTAMVRCIGDILKNGYEYTSYGLVLQLTGGDRWPGSSVSIGVPFSAIGGSGIASLYLAR